MSDEDHDLPVDTTEDQDVTDLDEKITAVVKKQTETLRRELDGVHRRNTKLEKLLSSKETELEDLKKASMDKDEKFKFELEKREQEIASRERALKIKENRERAMKYLSENELPSGIVEIISLDDWDSAKTKLEAVKGVVDSDRSALLESYKKNGGTRPRAGGPPLKTGPKKKSEMSLSEAQAFAREHGVDAFQALPD